MLREYAFIGDGCRGALIGPGGDLAWMCFPGWSDEARFAGLLGGSGSFLVAPEGRYVTGGEYEDGSLIWHSRWVADGGVFESRDALGYPGSPERAVVLRRVRAVEGAGEMVVKVAPACDYGRRPFASWRRAGRFFEASDGEMRARLGVAEALAPTASRTRRGELTFRFKAVPGEVWDFVLELCAGDLPFPPPDADEAWETTKNAWQQVVPTCAEVVAGGDVRRSFAVLRAMTGPHGGTVAAATTSLPERAEAGRNYDYRFCWVRDTCYIGHAGAALTGGEVMLDDAVRWVSQRLLADGASTRPAYLGNGEPVPPPTPLGLPGYPGGTDVVGNRVRDQFQLDVFGEALLLLARAAGRDRLDAEGWRAAEVAISAIERRWREPEAGIWETADNHWTHGQLISVAGLRAICAAGAPSSWATRALPLADHILDHTNTTSLHPSGRWQRAPDDERSDAALLLAEVRGALSPHDPRSERTRQAVRDELGKDHYLYRFNAPEHPLGEQEGAFLICNFWMTLATLGVNDAVEAARWFERGRAAMSTAGLFSEEFDTNEHQLRGNLPQAFVHGAFVEAAVAQGPC